MTGDAAATDAPARRPLRPARAARRRLVRGDRDRLAGAPQAAPSGRRRCRRADELAKRINVAHDWLSDPDLRARYDRERHPAAPAAAARGRRRRPAAGPAPPAPPVRRRAAPVRRPVDPAEALARHLDRIRPADRRTSSTGCRSPRPPPIAFIATISRFLPPDRQEALETLEPMVQEPCRGGPAGTRRRATRRSGSPRRSSSGRSSTSTCPAPFRERVRERLTRGWQAAVDQPRYGPNTAAVVDALAPARGAAAGRAGADRRRRGAADRRAGRPSAGRAACRRRTTTGCGSPRRSPSATPSRSCPSRSRRSPGAPSAGRCTRSCSATAFKAAEVERLAGPWARSCCRPRRQPRERAAAERRVPARSPAILGEQSPGDWYVEATLCRRRVR